MIWQGVPVKKIKEKIMAGYHFTPEEIHALREDPRSAARTLARGLDKLDRERERVARLYEYERSLYQEGYELIAGTDEAGRGPLAGPVVAGAVILPRECFISGLNDSKKISEAKRGQLEAEIKEKALAWAVGAVGAYDIDRINILEAAKLAMARAVRNLFLTPQYILVDAITVKEIDLPQLPIIKGDAKSASIAAASILAKCHRDRMMEIYHRRFPQYGFNKHKGYPTAEHILLLEEHGETCLHRKTFHYSSKTGNKQDRQ